MKQYFYDLLNSFPIKLARLIIVPIAHKGSSIVYRFSSELVQEFLSAITWIRALTKSHNIPPHFLVPYSGIERDTSYM